MKKILILLLMSLLLVGSASAIVTQYNSTDGSYTINLFNGTGSSNWIAPSGVSSVEFLLVAGGGGGWDSYGAGGGGGGVIYNASFPVVVGTTYTLSIGAGGGYGAMGTNSTFSTYTAVGGGWGGGQDGGDSHKIGTLGGSGGGSAVGFAAGGNVSGQGFPGGGSIAATSGGGGGCLEPGGWGNAIAYGGGGCNYTISGSLVSYGGGGTGNRLTSSHYGSTVYPNSGVSGTGAGRSGDSTGSTMGGSGTVILKYTTDTLRPILSFTANSTGGLQPLSVQFNDTSITTPTAWNWSYTNVTPGNNTPVYWSTIQNATQTFEVGHWHINLNVTNASGYNNTLLNYPLDVTPPTLTANFTGTPLGGASGTAVTFTDNTTGSGISAWTYNWSFGDGVVNTTANPVHTYSANGVYDVNLTVYNASVGYSTKLRSGYITISDSGGLSGWNRQDILMDQIYTFTLNVKDSVSLSGIPGATVATSNGDNTTTSVLGVATISTNYTALVVQVGATGYYSRTISYVVDRDRTETIYLTPIVVVPTAVPNTNIIYTPKQIELTVVSYDPAGVVVKNASVTLAAVANTLQADSQLETLYGINPIAANQLMNGTLVMHGLTDSGGGIVFTVLQSINYAATIVDPRDGKTYTAMLYPGLDPYTIWIGTSPLAINTTAHTYLNTTKIFITQPDVANVTMNMQYQNKLGTTTSVVFTVKYQNNLTTAYQTTIAGFGTSMVYANYTVPNVRGQGYFYGYNASRNV